MYLLFIGMSSYDSDDQGRLWAIQSLSYKFGVCTLRCDDVPLRYGGANPEFWVSTKKKSILCLEILFFTNKTQTNIPTHKKYFYGAYNPLIFKIGIVW